MPSPRLGQSARQHDVPRRRELVDVAAPRQRLRTRCGCRAAGRASRACADRARCASGSPWRASTSTSTPAAPSQPSAWHISSIDFATSILYSCRWPDRPSKSRSTWKPVTRRPLARTACDRRRRCPRRGRRGRCADSITCEKPALAHRRKLGRQRPGERDRVHAEVGDVDAAPIGCTGRRHHALALVVHQLEHRRRRDRLCVSAPRALGVHALGFDERPRRARAVPRPSPARRACRGRRAAATPRARRRGCRAAARSAAG